MYGIVVAGNIRLELWHQSSRGADGVKMAQATFHTAFIEPLHLRGALPTDPLCASLTWGAAELDGAHKEHAARFPKRFSLEVSVHA